MLCCVQGGEVAILAGTGTDPGGRVAYVKTVQSGMAEPAGSSTPYPTALDAPAPYGNVDASYEGSAGVVKHMVVSADINPDQVTVKNKPR